MKLSFTFLLLGIILGCSLNETTENAKSLSVIQKEVLVGDFQKFMEEVVFYKT